MVILFTEVESTGVQESLGDYEFNFGNTEFEMLMDIKEEVLKFHL